MNKTTHNLRIANEEYRIVSDESAEYMSELAHEIDLKMAVEAVSTMVGGKYIQDELSEQKIIDLVADYYNLTPSIVTGNSHTRQIVLARHVAMYLIRYTLDTPLKKIGEVFSGKDHTTVMNGISKVEKMLKTDQGMQTAISELKKRIK